MPQGKIKWFNKDKGYGFIIDEDGRDIFLHFSRIKSLDSVCFLTEGACVEFNLELQSGKLSADNVSFIPKTNEESTEAVYNNSQDIELKRICNMVCRRDNIGDNFSGLLVPIHSQSDNSNRKKVLYNDTEKWPFVGFHSEANVLSELFQFVLLTDGTYKIISLVDGKALDVDCGNKDDNTNVVLWGFHGGENQRWCIEIINEHPTPTRLIQTFRLTPLCAPNSALTYCLSKSNSDSVLISTIDDTQSEQQQFYIWRVEPEKYIRSNLHLGNQTAINLKKVFIVHGHDTEAVKDVKILIKDLMLKPIILFEQVGGGNTIIENVEKHSDVGFAIVLYTPCDEGRASGEEVWKSRARQNVVFEHGYMVAKLSRSRVCALKKGSIEIPSDYNGVVYINMDNGNEWKYRVVEEMQAAGYNVSKDDVT